jgi:hypothetical protein
VINEFHNTEAEFPTLKQLLKVLQKKANFSDGKSDVSKIIRDSGFRWRKLVSNKKSSHRKG